MTTYAVKAFSPSFEGGRQLVKGDVITESADKRAFYVQNGILKVTYEESSSAGTELGGLHYYRTNGSTTYDRAVSAQYGDYCFPTHGPLTICDEIRILTATRDVCEFSMQWDAYTLLVPTFSNNGIVDRDHAGTAIPGGGSGGFAYVTSVAFTKTVRLERGAEGVFVGYHFTNNIGPRNLATQNNDTAWGEREFGTGGGNEWVFSSAGFQAQHPEWGANSNWGGGSDYSTARHAWYGIDDANYAPYSNADYIAYHNNNANGEGTVFPHEQATGPWWVADLPSVDQGWPFCRYIFMRDKLEVGSWQFAAGQRGFTVVHFVNEIRSELGHPYDYQLFFGIFPHVNVGAPDATLKARVAGSGPVTWPQVGAPRGAREVLPALELLS